MALIGKLLRDPSTLKLMRDPVSEKLMRANPYGVDCGNCDAGTTPKRITVTFSGIILCVGCWGPWAGGYRKWVHNFDINQSFILEQTASPCHWSYTKVNGVTCESYSDDACQNFIGSADQNVHFEAYLFGSPLRISLSVQEPYYGAEYFLLSSAERDSNCMNLANAANEKTTCEIELGHDGTVTFVDGP